MLILTTEHFYNELRIDKILFPVSPPGRRPSWDPSNCDVLLQLWEHCMFMKNLLLGHGLLASLSSSYASMVIAPKNGDCACLQNQLLSRNAFPVPPVLSAHTLNATEHDSSVSFKGHGLTSSCLRTGSPHWARPSDRPAAQSLCCGVNFGLVKNKPSHKVQLLAALY